MVERPSWLLLACGPPRLRAAGDGGREQALGPLDAAWLALAASGEGLASRQVALLVWPEAGERGALNNLHQRVHRLRKATGARLVETAGRLVLAPDLQVPAEDLDALAADADAQAPEWLAGCDYDDRPALAAWVQRCRDSRRAAWHEALAARAAGAEHEGALALALRCGERLLALDPLSEHAHRRLMRLHHLRGDRAAAVAAFERCERMLKDELGLAPDAETRALLATVERGRSGAWPLAAPVPAALLRPPRLAGRADALARLAAAERDGEPVLLVGEAGIGKTRLLQEHLFDRGDALLVQARPGDAGEPFATLQRLLARLPPDAGEDGKVRPERLRATLRHRLAAAAQAGLRIVAFDDLHFADRASLELLQALAAETTALRWLFAQRPVAGTDEPMAALADSSGTCRLVLAPLQRDALVELLQGLGLPPAELPALAGELLQRCGGNPLFVLETLRAAWREGAPRGPLALPQGMAHLVGLRLSRLSPEALALARVAAIAAPDFDLALAEQVLGTGALQLAGPWHELEAAQVLRGEQFAHDLIQDAVRAAIPQVIARHAHRQVAACLAARGATPARLARHWQAAGDEHAAAGCYAAAANLAEAACRPREQAELLAACANAHAAAGDADAALRARIARVEALLQSAGSTAAIDAAQALLPACSGALAARAQATLALALCWGGRLDEARAAAQAALNDPAADDDARVRATALLAQAEALQGRPEAGLVLMQPWRVRIEQLGDAALRRDFHGYLSNLLIRLSRSGEALPAAERHLTLARETASAGEELIALMNLAALHGRRGDPERAVAFGREADRLASDIEHSAAIAWWNRGQLGFWLAGTGRFGEALALLEAAVEALDDNPVQRNMALTLLARVWLVLGQPARAHQTLQALTAAPPGPLLVGQLAVRALVSAALGGPALPLWREAAGAAGPNEPGVLQARIELACDAGDPDALAALQRRADELEMFPISAEAATRALALSADAGLGCAAEAAERRALGAPGPLFYLPGQLLQCAQAFERAHRPADARRCFDAALHWVHRVALPQLPAPFVEGFLHRNPANVALRAAAARQDGRISGR